MEAKEYKLENVLEKLIKELRGNNYLVHSYTEGDPYLTFEISKEYSKNHYRCNPIGRIFVGDGPNEVETTIMIYGGRDFLKDKKKVLSITNKYLEKRHKDKITNKNPKATKSNFEEYQHHQWHNDGYRTARKWKPKYTSGSIDKRKTPPQ